MPDIFSTLMDTLETVFRDTAVEEANDTSRSEWAELVHADSGTIKGYKQQLWGCILDCGEDFFDEYDFSKEIGDIDSTLADITAGLKDEAKVRMLAWLATMVEIVTNS